MDDPNVGAPQRPVIIINRRELRDVLTDTVAAIRAANEPPSIFRVGTVLATVQANPIDNDDQPAIEVLERPTLRKWLSEIADFRTQSVEGDLTPTFPPQDIVNTLISQPGHDFPRLDLVVHSPVFSASGEIITTPGYNPANHTFYVAHEQQEIVVPATPTNDKVVAARHLLMGDLMGDFPFVDDASRAHALAALLQLFVRKMIDGPTPIYLVDSPTQGTGKGLLADMICLPATSQAAPAFPEAKDDDEWRKGITAKLAEAPTAILIDNVKKPLGSAVLALVLTRRVWRDRILGVSKNAKLPVEVLWLATGNNLRPTGDIPRRSIWIRLDAGMERPWLDRKFRHELPAWAESNRAELAQAALVLVQNWIARGKPFGTRVLGSFESWSRVMGGILNAADVRGFLGNLERLYDEIDEMRASWRELVASWHAHHATAVVGTAQLYLLARDDEGLAHVLGDGSEESRRIRLGRALGRLADQVFGGYRIRKTARRDRSGRNLFYLEPVAPEATSAAVPLEAASGNATASAAEASSVSIRQMRRVAKRYE